VRKRGDSDGSAKDLNAGRLLVRSSGWATWITSPVCPGDRQHRPARLSFCSVILGIDRDHHDRYRVPREYRPKRQNRRGRSPLAGFLRSYLAMARGLPRLSPHGGHAGVIRLPSRPEDVWPAWPCPSISKWIRRSPVAMVVLCGCAGTRDSRRAGRGRGNSPHATPVVIERPSLSARLDDSHRQEAERAAMATTEVEGGMKE
jgi:hypothetical protein